MNINRDNYETFFLLYVDNELSATERRSVEEFAAANPDLQEELAQLQSVVMDDDAVLFDDKISLLRPENVEEKLLLLLDNELDATAAADFKQALASSEMLKKELAVLQQTKLDPADSIVFEDKQSLYRKEKDNVIAGRFIRWAAAAMLIGAGTFAVIKISRPAKINETEIAGGKKTVGEKKNIIVAPKAKASENADDNETITNQASDNIAQAPRPQNGPAVEPKTNTADRSKKDGFVKNNDRKVIKDKEILPVQKSVQSGNDEVLLANNQKVEKIIPEESNISMAINVPKKVIIDQNIMETHKNSFASNASLSEEKNDDRVLYLNEDDVSRTKAVGFLRKLKRTVERKAKIKGNGNGLKIAGFEIALN